MKKILLCFAAITALNSCKKDCPHGYGPDDCDQAWSAKYEGAWLGTGSCQPSPSSVSILATISAENAHRIWLDNLIYGELTGPNDFEVPNQTFVDGGQTYTVNGIGWFTSDNHIHYNRTVSGPSGDQYCEMELK